MPTYTVHTANLSLSPEQKGRLAEAITAAHNRHTGAPGYLAQVLVIELARASHFIGGKPNTAAHVYVHGLIRAGRTRAAKQALIEDILARAKESCGVGTEDVWVYLQEIAAEQMAEFGRLLPQPGAEGQWRQGFTPEKIAAFIRAGVTL